MSFENAGDDVKIAGAGRGTRSAKVGDVQEVRIFCDSSSLEVFVNGGEYVFTTRFFPGSDMTVKAEGITGEMNVWDLNAFHIDREDGTPLYPKKTV